MNKNDRIYAFMGLIMPWITLVLLIGLSVFYCDLLWLKSICVAVAIINGSITLRLAKCVLFPNKEDR